MDPYDDGINALRDFLFRLHGLTFFHSPIFRSASSCPVYKDPTVGECRHYEVDVVKMRGLKGDSADLPVIPICPYTRQRFDSVTVTNVNHLDDRVFVE